MTQTDLISTLLLGLCCLGMLFSIVESYRAVSWLRIVLAFVGGMASIAMGIASVLVYFK